MYRSQPLLRYQLFKVYILARQSIPMQKKQQKKMNKYIMAAQILAASFTAFAVSPLNVVVDKSVMIFSKNQVNLFGIARTQLVNILKHPLAFLGDFSFRWMFFVYVPTYSANNLFDHYNLAALFGKPETDFIEHKYQKLGVVFLVNTICSLIKDKKYAQKYANKLPSFPMISYGLFFTRDLIAMAGAFTLPPILAPILQQKLSCSKASSERIAQLTCPLMIQLIGTPIHLAALDINNNPQSTIGERFKRIKSIYPSTLALRMMRFLPAYGIGGIVNIELRRYLKENAPADE